MKTITTIGNFRFNAQQSSKDIADMVVKDFAVKCATVLSEYCDPIAN